VLTINTVAKDRKAIDITPVDVLLSGVFCWVAFVAFRVIYLSKKFVKQIKKQIKYKSLIIDDSGSTYFCEFTQVDKILNKNKSFKFANSDNFQADFKYWNKEFCNGYTPNVRYAPKEVWKRFKKYKLDQR
jgi:hypothetical protein